MSQFPLLISFVYRNIFRNRSVASMVIAGLMFAGLAILSISGVFNGLSSAMEESEAGWLGDIVVTPRNGETSIRGVQEVTKRLIADPNVAAYSIRSSGNMPMKYNDRWAYPYGFFGVDKDLEANATLLPSRMIEGKFIDGSMRPDEVILGTTLADSFIGTPYDGSRLKAGDQVLVLTPDGTVKPFTVRGIMDAKTFFPNWAVIMQKDELEKLTTNQKNSSIAVRLIDPKKSIDTKDALQRLLPSVIVLTWRENSGYVDDILKTLGFVRTLIETLLILVVFMITSIVIYIDISQKRKQLGIMKAMGADDKFVSGSYFIQTAFYCVSAFSLGSVLFLGIHLYFVNNPVPVQIGTFRTVATPGEFFETFLILLVASGAGSIIPIRSALKAKIVDVMRS